MTVAAHPVRTGLPAGSISTTSAERLTDGWSFASARPGAVTDPSEWTDDGAWRPAVVPGTVASSHASRELDDHDDYDADDWWYRCAFPDPRGGGTDERVRLRFDGLATLATVWLNGERVLDSANMFVAWHVDVTELLRAENELAIVFHSLEEALRERRPRPAWKTALVEEQRLRWFRTTLLGRIPGWTPRIPPVGPWRPVWVETVAGADPHAFDLRPGVVDGVPRVTLSSEWTNLGAEITSATLRVGERSVPLEVDGSDDRVRVSGEAELEGLELWWPRTQGDPVLHDCSLELDTGAGTTRVACGRLGFRDLRVDRDGGAVRFVVNGVPVFCRGSCWTTTDILGLDDTGDDLRDTLTAISDAHANMVRVGGTMVYPSRAFYESCDALGLMVWQDFMFANMEYPAEDDFLAKVEPEIVQLLERVRRHPSVVALCGGSEIEQQAAMFGAERERWITPLFAEVIPRLADDLAPELPYWTSTPTGGSLPFHTSQGPTHYYGVGAYLRPLEDARTAGVRFTTECLGFAHVPEDETLAELTPAGAVPPHHPAWKAGVPRDSGVGWDFDDVRDHYLEERWRVDARLLRSHDLERYLALSRVVSAETTARAFDLWRDPTAPCDGGLTWFLRDLRPGAGWGMLDSAGRPKAVYHALTRAWAPRTVRLLDRGLDGLKALVFNDRPEPLRAALELLVLSDRGAVVAEHSEPLDLPPHGDAARDVEGLLGRFLDPTYSYRFGPLRHEAIVARLLDVDADRLLAEDVYRPVVAPLPTVSSLDTDVTENGDGSLTVTLSTSRILCAVRVEARGYRPDDAYFWLTPGRSRSITLERTTDSDRSFRGFVGALNLDGELRLPKPS